MCHELRARAATAGQGGRAAEAGGVRAVLHAPLPPCVPSCGALPTGAPPPSPYCTGRAAEAGPIVPPPPSQLLPLLWAEPPRRAPPCVPRRRLPGVPPTMHMPPTLCRQHRRRAQFVCYVFVCSVGWCAKTAAARSGFGVADFLWKEVLQLPMDRAPHDGFFSMPWKLFDLPATLRAPVWPVQQYSQYSRGVPYSKVHQKHIYII